MKRIVRLLEDLRQNDLDDDGDLILFEGIEWIERIDEALQAARIYSVLIFELQEGVDPDFYVELKQQLGLE